jgi:hypothetical protein
VEGCVGEILKRALKFSDPSKPASEQESGQSPSIFSQTSVLEETEVNRAMKMSAQSMIDLSMIDLGEWSERVVDTGEGETRCKN